MACCANAWRRSTGMLSWPQRIFLAVLLVGLIAANLYNTVRSVQKTVSAYRKPVVSITVDRRAFPPLVFASCLDHDLFVKPFSSLSSSPMAITVAYFGSLDDFISFNSNGVTTLPSYRARVDTLEPTSMFLSTRRFDCVKVSLPPQYRISPSSTAFVYVSSEVAITTGGVNMLTFVQDANMPFPPADATYANVQFRGAAYQASMSQRVLYSLSSRVVSTDITMALEAQSLNEPVNTSVVYLAADRCSFDATILTQSVAFDYLDCLSSIFAWASATGALMRILFPMLPFGRRARFFCGSGPPDEEASIAAGGKMTEL
eukprot:c46255_g1_i1.p1 GENE.c46255_g1_i1~~c46255_g1_i1.p1  ORF type:complete len:316 (-),score=30.32 c46255_g1_i1:102-1049(-)